MDEPLNIQFARAIEQSGLTPPRIIYMDGEIHRFNSGTKNGSRDETGWYIAFSDGVPAGRFGDWRTRVDCTWRANSAFTPEQEKEYAKRMEEARRKRDADRLRQYEAAADLALTIWSNSAPAPMDHPYLVRKGILPHGARVTGDGRLVLPLYDESGGISSLQFIDNDGRKLYQSGSATAKRYWHIGNPDSTGTLYIVEGFSTAASVFEATAQPVIIAYNASNIVGVTGIMREMYGHTKDIVIVADNDKNGVGKEYAEQAAQKHGARVVMPPEGDANDYAAAGGDLVKLLAPPSDDWLVPADDFCTKPAPIRWLVRDWLQQEALMMVFGPSGGGKTFVVLDWCLHIASDIGPWCGKKTKAGSVVYLAGEGHHGLRGRIAAWKQHYQYRGSLNMWLSKGGCDLNTPEGYMRVVDSIRSLDEMPSLIVVDTLHRFLLGDENSAQDAKVMIDACAALMREFGGSVLLVHHTGVSEETQNRARGSSAWRGAVDIEIGISPYKSNNTIKVTQTKSKDSDNADQIFVKLDKVNINGWFDEDGEQVSSAVVMPSDKGDDQAPDDRGSKKLDQHKRTMEKAWWATGGELKGDYPYVTRSGLRAKLEQDGHADRTIKNMMNPSYDDRLIGCLLNANVIEEYEHGWVIVDPVLSSALILSASA